MPELCLQSRRRRGATLIGVIGRLDQHTAAGFSEHLSTLLVEEEPHPTSVVLDLRCCTALDAAGATAVADLQRTVAAQGGTLHLEGVSPLIEHALHRWRSDVSGTSTSDATPR